MKSTKLLLLLLPLVMILSCKKKSKEINYPSTVFFGNNVLSLASGTVLKAGDWYEMGAVLGEDANLNLVITNLSKNDGINGMPVWYYTDEQGWAVTFYDDVNNTQKFMSSLTKKIDLKMTFMAWGEKGKCRIDFYENSGSITQTKYFTWE